MDKQNDPQPTFPRRAVITAGMPYGNKPLHVGHLGGNLIPADIYARFLRDRIGPDNVLFVTGSDCYGADSELKYKTAKEDGFGGSIEDFLTEHYQAHRAVLDGYGISLDIYGASAFGEAKETHHALSAEIFNELHENKFLRQDETLQFYDESSGTWLNGRQVTGRCPIAGCKSETAYADECSLGHQFNPAELIAPRAVDTGREPALEPVSNWYFDLERFSGELIRRQNLLKDEGRCRRYLLSVIDEFLKPPAISIKSSDADAVLAVSAQIPSHRMETHAETGAVTLAFDKLSDREQACRILAEHKIRYRTKTTLTPFRLSGNVAWGIPVPPREGASPQTFWVWPESLWAPISFTKTILARESKPDDAWRRWWFDPESHVYQFIGEDNIYFYAVAGMGLFMAMEATGGLGGEAALPYVIPSRHVFFGNKKAASSGAVKPPLAAELLAHYTAEQLRMHFGHMALQSNSVSFNPKALTGEVGFDATLAEGNILTNVFNRLVRSCFYTMQKYFADGAPSLEPSVTVKQDAAALVDGYERAMYRFEFSRAIDLLDVYIKEASKSWSAQTKEADADGDGGKRAKALADGFWVVRAATVLLHPFAPWGTERVREYLNFDERFWDWAHIDKPLSFFMGSGHAFKFLEPRVDFFTKHPSQLK